MNKKQRQEQFEEDMKVFRHNQRTAEFLALIIAIIIIVTMVSIIFYFKFKSISP